ncbi:hypothetical protein RJ55_06401 [Drechmeria coniospora]|nr:hypothetical protein RJ55_06401 [Drechmeria coniospora]
MNPDWSGQVVDAALHPVQSVLAGRDMRNDGMLYSLASILVWSIVSVSLHESKAPFWPAYLLAWTSAAVLDATLLCFSIFSLPSQNLPLDGGRIGQLTVHAIRVAILLAVAGYAFYFAYPIVEEAKIEEQTHLLANEHSSSRNDYDSACSPVCSSILDVGGEDDDDNASDDEDEREIKEMQQKRLEERGGWLSYLRSFAIFLPYLVPRRDRSTQLWLLILGLCMAVGRVLTLMLPRQLGILTESLGHMAGTGSVPWKNIVVWALLQFPISTATLSLEAMASTRLSQYAYQKLTDAAFSHVMTLSMDYHTAKSSGRVAKAIEQGSNLSQVLNSMLNVAPMIVDFAIAIVYLTSSFDVFMGFIVIATAMTHAFVAYKGNKYTIKYERDLVETSRVENEVLYDSITNWPTVAYHNRQPFEQERYSRTVRKALLSQRRYHDGYEWINVTESFVMYAGLIAACSLMATRVATGAAKLSSFVFLVSYWDAIRSPMVSLSWTLREAAAHLIDAEWLYQLLQTKPSVADKDGAHEIRWNGGRVEFRNVSFSYSPDRPIIRDMTFTVKPGQSIALVGETGGGKSTTLKLLYRFYDVTGGSITIDGQDIRDVKLDSLRESLGAVPQDPSVFDQTIMENILYARPGANEADVIEACKAARIHDQIMTFPEAYRTRLGERGVRLSGGELQRMAIARVMLRKPQIVVLDEATSAVDSDTEALVQRAIRELSRGRTVFTVAHRLSTVVSADVILVIDAGRVAEQGTHRELLALGGKYSRLWGMQTDMDNVG